MRTRLLAPERRSGFYEAPLEIPGCHGVLRSDGLLDGDAPESPEARSACGSVFLAQSASFRRRRLAWDRGRQSLARNVAAGCSKHRRETWWRLFVVGATPCFAETLQAPRRDSHAS